MVLRVEEVEAKIMEKVTKWQKPRLFYLFDFCNCDPERSRKDIKNIVNGLVDKGELMFVCTGATIMYAIPEQTKNEEDAERGN